VHRTNRLKPTGTDTLANQLNAQELARVAGMPAAAPPYPAPMMQPAYPAPVAQPGYPPAYYPPPPWYAPPRPWGWRRWWGWGWY
jgi:hypothetical protein